MSTWETFSNQPGDRSDAGDDRFEWIDGQGRPWTIVANPTGISMDCQDDRIEIPRERFGSDLYVSPVGEQVVVRFAGPDQEAGFLVPKSAAAALLGRLRQQVTTPEQRTEADRRAAPRIQPAWPEMTAASVWALICAALAFQPVVGIGFAIAAVILIVRQRTRTRRAPVTLHIRIMLNIASGLVLWGLAVWALSTWTWFQPLDHGQECLPESFFEGVRDKWTVLILGLLVVLASLTVHEASHAIAAWWCGDGHARSLGRVTLNPMAHIDLFGTVLLPLILALAGAPVFGYAKPVPVQLAGIGRFRRAHILISIAGPGSNLLMAALSLSLLLAVGCILRYFIPPEQLASLVNLFSAEVRLSGFPLASVASVLLTVLKLSFQINALLAAFNLIPIPPLDGSWVLEHLFPNTLGRFYARIRPFGFLIFLGLLYTEVLGFLLVPAVIAAVVIHVLLFSCVLG